jgi:hypothetical protein
MKNTIPLSFMMPPPSFLTPKKPPMSFIHMHVHINAKVLDFPMQIDIFLGLMKKNKQLNPQPQSPRQQFTCKLTNILSSIHVITKNI